MTLIKSKIKSLAWLKSAICISVVGGVMLSSKTVLAATLTGQDSSTNLALVLSENGFGGLNSYSYPTNNNWKANFFVTRSSTLLSDNLIVTVALLHTIGPHKGDNTFGDGLNLIFNVNSGNAVNNVVSSTNSDVSKHPPNHSDRANGILQAVVSNGFLGQSDIVNWTLRVNADHSTQPVPEPTTMLGTALALGGGGWLKRKNSIKQNKIKSQG